MGREWKPGDVALVRNEHGIWNVAICTLRSSRHGYWWRYGVAESYAPITAEAHPLVVIDPEDREQVERLVDAYVTEMSVDEHSGDHRGAVLKMQAALREFANPKPPKPVEPTGLGAVVEDVDGDRWVRTDDEGEFWWHPPSRKSAKWAELRAVRVLSEGVPQ